MHTCLEHHICIADAIANAEQLCNDKHLRFTGLRKRVLELIWAHPHPVKAYDLLDQLKQEDKNAKPPTLYRSLDFLLEHGLVHRINSLNAFIGCTHPHAHRSCYFLICSTCHTVEESCAHTLHDALQQNCKSQGFTPLHISVEIEGICRDCAKEGTL